jgi:hypothetical protein
MSRVILEVFYARRWDRRHKAGRRNFAPPVAHPTFCIHIVLPADCASSTNPPLPLLHGFKESTIVIFIHRDNLTNTFNKSSGVIVRLDFILSIGKLSLC